MVKAPKRFFIYWVNLDPTKGREIKKTRPCIVISPDVMNNFLDTVIVVPLTSTINDWPFRTKVKIKGKVSSAACDQMRTISKDRLQTKIGQINNFEKQKLLGIIQSIFIE